MSALYRRKPEVVEALRVIIGVTTEEQIKALDPKANVGIANVNPLALRWVILSNGQAIASWGDWIVKSATGRLRIFTATQFALDYKAIL